MYIPTHHAFVNNTDTPDQRHIHELGQFEDCPCRRINKIEQIVRHFLEKANYILFI